MGIAAQISLCWRFFLQSLIEVIKDIMGRIVTNHDEITKAIWIWIRVLWWYFLFAVAKFLRIWGVIRQSTARKSKIIPICGVKYYRTFPPDDFRHSQTRVSVCLIAYTILTIWFTESRHNNPQSYPFVCTNGWSNRTLYWCEVMYIFCSCIRCALDIS